MCETRCASCVVGWCLVWLVWWLGTDWVLCVLDPRCTDLRCRIPKMVVGKVGAFFLNVWGFGFHRHRHGEWADRGFGGLGFWRSVQKPVWGFMQFWGRDS